MPWIPAVFVSSEENKKMEATKRELKNIGFQCPLYLPRGEKSFKI